MKWRRLLRDRSAIEVGVCTDVGRVRSENQDAYGVYPEEVSDADVDRIFIVADGMGGHAHGREASHAAVRIVQRVFDEEADRDAEGRLQHALEAANHYIYTSSNESGLVQRPGTTCTALAWVGGRLFIGHVGDSRAFRLRRGHIEQLTTDHSWVNEMEREGLLTEEEAQVHPRRNTLTRAIGTSRSVDVEVVQVGQPRAGDTFLLCSDGLADVDRDEMQRIVRSEDTLQDASERLVHEANALGGHDNVTVMLVRFN